MQARVFFAIIGGSRPILGDFLVIAGTIFFALSNVGEVSESSVIANMNLTKNFNFVDQKLGALGLDFASLSCKHVSSCDFTMKSMPGTLRQEKRSCRGGGNARRLWIPGECS